MCYNKAREAESFLRPDRGFPAFPNLTKGVSASPVGSMGRADGCLVMKITIVGRKVNLRNNFKELAERKLSKFNRIFDEDAEATVTVTVERNRQTVEITIKQRGMIYRAEETSLEMNEALDHVIAALGRQIRRNKTRLEKAKKVDPNIDFPDALYDEPDEEIHVVRTKSFYVKVMTPEEAILQMNMLGHQFFMFRDDSTGEINVVYRRKDGDYGLLVPESKYTNQANTQRRGPVPGPLLLRFPAEKRRSYEGEHEILRALPVRGGGPGGPRAAGYGAGASPGGEWPGVVFRRLGGHGACQPLRPLWGAGAPAAGGVPRPLL